MSRFRVVLVDSQPCGGLEKSAKGGGDLLDLGGGRGGDGGQGLDEPGVGHAGADERPAQGLVLHLEEGLALGLSHYLVEPGQGLAKALELADRIAQNTALTNFAVMHVLPRIAESDPASGYMMESLMAAIAQGDQEAKARLQAFLDGRAPKVARS